MGIHFVKDLEHAIDIAPTTPLHCTFLLARRQVVEAQ